MCETKLLKNFNVSKSKNEFSSSRYNDYEKYLKVVLSGEGMIGDNSYLLLWEKDEIEELNDAYEVSEYLNDCILVGSDGGDIAYGIRKNGVFFSVPFIGMSNDEIHNIGETFAQFLQVLYEL